MATHTKKAAKSGGNKGGKSKLNTRNAKKRSRGMGTSVVRPPGPTG